MTNKRTIILEEAIKIINGERTEQYGEPDNNFFMIAQMWTTYTGTYLNEGDVAAMMILLKVARLKKNQTEVDHWVDIAGYAGCGGEVMGAE